MDYKKKYLKYKHKYKSKVLSMFASMITSPKPSDLNKSTEQAVVPQGTIVSDPFKLTIKALEGDIKNLNFLDKITQGDYNSLNKILDDNFKKDENTYVRMLTISDVESLPQLYRISVEDYSLLNRDIQQLFYKITERDSDYQTTKQTKECYIKKLEQNDISKLSPYTNINISVGDISSFPGIKQLDVGSYETVLTKENMSKLPLFYVLTKEEHERLLASVAATDKTLFNTEFNRLFYSTSDENMPYIRKITEEKLADLPNVISITAYLSLENEFKQVYAQNVGNGNFNKKLNAENTTQNNDTKPKSTFTMFRSSKQ